MATIKDKIGLAMLPSAQSGGASASTTDFSGTVHSLLPIQHESPNLIIPDLVSGWTLSNGSVSNGVYTASLTAYQSGIKVTPPFIDSYTIKVTFDLVVNSGSIRVDDGLSGVVNTFSTSGSKEITFNGFNKIEFNAYNLGFDGTISNVKLTRITNGDFQFERSSSATRVGSDGYIKNVEVLSDELVQNGDFEDVNETELLSNGDFSNGSSTWVSISGLAVFENSTVIFENDAKIYTNSGADLSKIYKIEIDFNSISADGIQILVGNGNTFSQYSVSDITNNGNKIVHYSKFIGSQLLFIYSLSSNTSAVIDNVSVKEVGENWTFGDGWSITDDGGNLKAIASNSPSGSRLSQFNLGQNINKKHRIYYTVSNLSQGGFNIWFGGITGNNITENGTYYQEIIPTQTTQLFFYNIGTTTGQIDNISVVEITDDTDIPRLDFSNAAQPSLLLEPQRTNLVLNSEDISQFPSQTTITITSNAGTSPTGTNNAFKLTPTNSAGRVAHSGGGLQLNVGDTLTASVYVKNISWTQLYLSFYDIANGIYSGSPDFISQINTTEWTRVEFTYTVTQATNSWQLQFLRSGVDTGNEILAYAPQLEIGTYPTSYIPTNGSTVTRLADVCNNAGDSTIFNDAEGVLFAEFSREDVITNGHISVNDGTADNGVVIKVDTTANQLTGWVRRDAAFSMVRSFSVPEGFNKIAVKYKENDHSIFINGELVWSDTSGQSPTGLKTLSFSRFGTDSLFTGNCRQLLYFNEALTDAELERLTSSDITQVLRNYNRRGELLGATYESTHVQTKLNELF